MITCLKQQTCATHSPPSLPTKSFLSLKLYWKPHTDVQVLLFSSACEPYLQRPREHFATLKKKKKNWSKLWCAKFFLTFKREKSATKKLINRNWNARTSSSLHHAGCATLLLFLRQCGIIHLTDNFCKQLVHHCLAFGRGFNEGAAPLLCQSSSVRSGHLPFRFKVNFVANENQRHLLKALYSHYLVSHWSNVLEDKGEEL